jgi:hypothetical protein
MLHAPVTYEDICGQCSKPWPCDQVRLAYRLREDSDVSCRQPAWLNCSRDSWPVVYGYLRIESQDLAGLAALRQAIATFCEAEEFLLVTTFSDVGYDGTEIARPGFAALLDVLALPQTARLVIPDLLHLSADEAIREGLLRQVRRTGVSVVVISETNGTLDNTGITGQGAWIGDDDSGERS